VGPIGERVFFADSGRNAYLRSTAQTLEDAGVRALAWCYCAGFTRQYAQMINARR